MAVSSIVLLSFCFSPAFVEGSSSAGVAEARSRKSNTSTRSSKKKGKTVSSRSKSSRQKSRSSRGRKESKSLRGRKGGHHHRHHHQAVYKPPPPPSPEQIAANQRREQAYQTMAKAYQLYDEGINRRIAGDNQTAVSKLTESWKLFNEAKQYQRTGESSLEEALVHFELGQSAEALGDFLTARDSYIRCLMIRPSFVEASVHLVNLLARNGQWQMALAKAQDAVRANPDDSLAHLIFSLTLSKTGHKEEARLEAEKAQALLKVVPRYKPMGIDAVWRRTHQSPAVEGETESQTDSGKSDVDNPEDVMGDEVEQVEDGGADEE